MDAGVTCLSLPALLFPRPPKTASGHKMFSSTSHRPVTRRTGLGNSRHTSVALNANPSPPRTPNLLQPASSRYGTPQARLGRSSPLTGDGHANSGTVKLYANRPELTVSFASSLPKELSTVLSKSGKHTCTSQHTHQFGFWLQTFKQRRTLVQSIQTRIMHTLHPQRHVSSGTHPPFVLFPPHPPPR